MFAPVGKRTEQAAFPGIYDALPMVEILTEDQLFDCDMFVFCASKGIPPVGAQVQDVRMVQYEANKGIISVFAKKARNAQFDGLFAVVSDPVDPLCRAAFLASNEDEAGNFDGKGLRPGTGSGLWPWCYELQELAITQNRILELLIF